MRSFRSTFLLLVFIRRACAQDSEQAPITAPTAPLNSLIRPNASEVVCLRSEPKGCGSIRDKLACLSSKDGRSGYQVRGLQVGDEPCVWCGGGLCTSNNDAVCEPFDWLANGEGKAFTTLHARFTSSVAHCSASRDAIFGNLKCLTKQTNGCNSLKDMGSCLSSVDGRDLSYIAGFKVQDQPCVWCAGTTCESARNNLCEPYDYIINGGGHAFLAFHAIGNYMVAGCEDGHPVSHTVPDAVADSGMTLTVPCSNPAPIWSKVGKICGECQVVVPHISNAFASCDHYCASQGGIACRSASVAFSHSCDIERKSTCSASFEEGDSALCDCDPLIRVNAANFGFPTTPQPEVLPLSSPTESSFVVSAPDVASPTVASVVAPQVVPPPTRPRISPGPAALCSASPACAKIGHAGYCCPTEDDVRLECCSQKANDVSHIDFQNLPTVSPQVQASDLPKPVAAAVSTLGDVQGPLQNLGKDCWKECNNNSGFCEFCGRGNACCRKNFDKDTPLECKDIPTFLTWHHECVIPVHAVAPRDVSKEAAAEARAEGKSAAEQVAAAVTAASEASAAAMLMPDQQATVVAKAAGSAAIAAGLSPDVAATAAANVAKAAEEPMLKPAAEKVTAEATAAARTMEKALLDEGKSAAEATDAAKVAARKVITDAGLPADQVEKVVASANRSDFAAIAANEARKDAAYAGKSIEEQAAAAASAAASSAYASGDAAAATEAATEAAVESGQTAAQASGEATAAVIKAEIAETQAQAQRDLVFTGPTAVQNIGKDCWSVCNGRSGFCNFCGTGNACCRKSGDASPPLECQDIPVFLTWHHECVVPVHKPAPRAVAAAAAAEAKAAGRSSGQQIEAAATAANHASAAMLLSPRQTAVEVSSAAGAAAKAAGLSLPQAADTAADYAKKVGIEQPKPSGYKLAVQAATAAARVVDRAAISAGKLPSDALDEAKTAAEKAAKDAGIPASDSVSILAIAETAATESQLLNQAEVGADMARKFATASGKPWAERASDAAEDAANTALLDAREAGKSESDSKLLAEIAATEAGINTGMMGYEAAEVARAALFKLSLAAAATTTAVPTVKLTPKEQISNAEAAAEQEAKSAGKTPAEQVAAAVDAASKAAVSAGLSKEKANEEAAMFAGGAAAGAHLTPAAVAELTAAELKQRAAADGNSPDEQTAAAAEAAALAAMKAAHIAGLTESQAKDAANIAATRTGAGPEVVAKAVDKASELVFDEGKAPAKGLLNLPTLAPINLPTLPPMPTIPPLAVVAGEVAATMAKIEGKTPGEQADAAAKAAQNAASMAGASATEAAKAGKRAATKAAINAGLTPQDVGDAASQAAKAQGKSPEEQAVAAGQATAEAAAIAGQPAVKAMELAKVESIKTAAAAGMNPDEIQRVVDETSGLVQKEWGLVEGFDIQADVKPKSRGQSAKLPWLWIILSGVIIMILLASCVVYYLSGDARRYKQVSPRSRASEVAKADNSESELELEAPLTQHQAAVPSAPAPMPYYAPRGYMLQQQRQVALGAANPVAANQFSATPLFQNLMVQFNQLDTNHNGYIERPEWGHGVAQPVQAFAPPQVVPAQQGDLFDRIDTNHNALISRQEFSQAVASGLLR